jgi:Alternative complex III, ActD subunit
MTVYLTGEFRDRELLIEAIRSLRVTGIDGAALDLFSAEPVELPRGVLDRPSRMSLASVAGALAFGTLATAFIRYTQQDYKLVTGGMPVFSFWATGVITYEMTMLGAIVATFAWFLWESGLLRRREAAPVPRVEPGSMCLRVRCEIGQAAQAIETMRRNGAVEIARA